MIKNILVSAVGALGLAAPLAFASGNAITIPTSTVSDMLANVTAQVSDPGLFAVFVFIIGIPFAFWALKKIRGLVPSK